MDSEKIFELLQNMVLSINNDLQEIGKNQRLEIVQDFVSDRYHISKITPATEVRQDSKDFHVNNMSAVYIATDISHENANAWLRGFSQSLEFN